MMQSWWIRPEPGKIELELRTLPVPQPKAGELLVRVRAASLNRGELIAAIETEKVRVFFARWQAEYGVLGEVQSSGRS